MTNLLYPIPYLICFTFLVCLAFPIVKSDNSKIILYTKEISLVLLLIFFIGFRGFIYTDWFNYYKLHESIPQDIQTFKSFLISGKKYSDLEHGFLWYVYVIKMISSNYFFLQFISTLIDILILYFFFKKYIPKRIGIAFIFFFIFKGLTIEINLLRNSKAIMLFLISIEYIRERKLIKYIIINLIASLFHTSSLLYLPLYFFINKKYHKFLILFVFIVGNIIFLFSVKWVTGILSIISTITNTRLSLLIDLYTNSEFFSTGYGLTLGYIERTFSFILVYSFYDRLIKAKIDILFLNCIFMYWFVFLYFSEMFVLTQRLSILFIFSYWIIFPYLYDIISKREKQVFIKIVVLYGYILLFQLHHSIAGKYENVLFPHSSYSEKASLKKELDKITASRPGIRL